MRRSLALFAVLAWAAPDRPADPATPPPDLATRAWAITDAVMARNVDPPTRQEMILAGLKALHRAGKVDRPPGLARRVSDLQGPGALAAILAESWPGPAPKESGEVPEGVFFEGMLSVVPGGGQLLSAKQWKVEEQVEANLYVGIQVALGMNFGFPVFQQVLPGGPADQAGAKVGDAIEAIDGVSTKDMPLSEVVDRIRGEEGTEVVLRLRKSDPSRTAEVPMKRARLPRKTVEGLSPQSGGRWDVRLEGPAPIGYLKLTEIAGSTAQELRKFAAQMEDEGLRALVLDLRTVHRSPFHPTVLLADALLDGGVIGRVREGGSSRQIRAEPDALFRDWPMVVLTGPSRSAEVDWLCAGLQDNSRATILGASAVGPGPAGALVHSAVPLPGGEWFVRLATGRLERADGRPLRDTGPKGLPDRATAQRLANLADALQLPSRPQAGGNSGQGADTLEIPRGTEVDLLPQARAILETALRLPVP